jgi:hypothetical protein
LSAQGPLNLIQRRHARVTLRASSAIRGPLRFHILSASTKPLIDINKASPSRNHKLARRAFAHPKPDRLRPPRGLQERRRSSQRRCSRRGAAQPSMPKIGRARSTIFSSSNKQRTAHPAGCLRLRQAVTPQNLGRLLKCAPVAPPPGPCSLERHRDVNARLLPSARFSPISMATGSTATGQ